MHFIGLSQDLEKAWSGSCTYIASNTRSNSIFFCILQFVKSRSKEHVWIWAMRYSSFFFFEHHEVFFTKMNAMGKHGSFCNKPIVVIDIHIWLMFWEKFFNPFHFILVLICMSLQIKVISRLHQLFAHMKLLSGACWSKTRCNCIMISSLPMPFVNQF